MNARASAERERRLGGHAVLREAQLDVVRVVAQRAAVVEAAIAVERERDVPLEQRAYGRRRDRHVAHDHHLRGVGQARLGLLALFGGHHQALALDPDAGALRLHVEREPVVTRREQPPHAGLAGLGVRLVALAGLAGLPVWPVWPV
jgi:hypothetical protein